MVPIPRVWVSKHAGSDAGEWGALADRGFRQPLLPLQDALFVNVAARNLRPRLRQARAVVKLPPTQSTTQIARLREAADQTFDVFERLLPRVEVFLLAVRVDHVRETAFWPWRAIRRILNVIYSNRKQKDLHPWQQPLEDIERLVGPLHEAGRSGCGLRRRQFYDRPRCAATLAAGSLAATLTNNASCKGRSGWRKPRSAKAPHSPAFDPACFKSHTGDRHHSVLADSPKAAALHVAEQYLLAQERWGGHYSGLIVVGKGRKALYFLAETLFEELGYRLSFLTATLMRTP